MVADDAPSSRTEGAVESTRTSRASRSVSRPSVNRIQNSLDGRPVGRPRNQPGIFLDRNSTRSAMVAGPNDPTGTPTHSDGGGSKGGAPSTNTGPLDPPSPPHPSDPPHPPSRAKAAAARVAAL